MAAEYSERRRSQATTLFKFGGLSFIVGPLIYTWTSALEILGAFLMIFSLFALFSGALCLIESIIRDEPPTPLEIDIDDDDEW